MATETDELVVGFSNTMTARCRVLRGVKTSDLQQELKESEQHRSLCIRGSGISYADMILNDRNSILDLSHLDGVLEWDPDTGIILVESGVKIGSILRLAHRHG